MLLGAQVQPVNLIVCSGVVQQHQYETRSRVLTAIDQVTVCAHVRVHYVGPVVLGTWFEAMLARSLRRSFFMSSFAQTYLWCYQVLLRAPSKTLSLNGSAGLPKRTVSIT